MLSRALHVLLRSLVPPPHDFEQDVQVVQSVHSLLGQS